MLLMVGASVSDVTVGGSWMVGWEGVWVTTCRYSLYHSVIQGTETLIPNTREILHADNTLYFADLIFSQKF